VRPLGICSGHRPPLRRGRVGRSDAQLARRVRLDELEAGETAFAAGDPAYDLIVIEQGAIEVVRPSTVNGREASVVTFGPGAFVGELDILSGQTNYLTARVVDRARMHRISPLQLRRLMVADPELSDVVLRAFVARRRQLSAGPAGRGLRRRRRQRLQLGPSGATGVLPTPSLCMRAGMAEIHLANPPAGGT
jgi:CRP-like cAMP-binding protein